MLWFVLLHVWVLIDAGSTDTGLRLLGLMGGWLYLGLSGLRHFGSITVRPA